MQSKKIPFYLFAFVTLVTSMLLIISSCGPVEEEVVPETTVTGYATDEISAVHKVGESPCPQRVGSVEVFCFEGEEYYGCDADSVAVKNSHLALNMSFPNGQSSTSLSNGQGSISLTVDFNCGQTTSFTHDIELCFFKDGQQVATETARVTMTIEE